MKTLYQSIRYVKSPVEIGDVSDRNRAELERIANEELDQAKRRIFESPEYNGNIQAVLQGQATFRSYGEPIIEHVRKVEEEYANRRFGYISKAQILGRDGRADIQEVVQGLRQQRIIDPNQFFTSSIVVAKGNEINKFFWKYPIANVGLSLFGMTIGGILGYGATKDAEIGLAYVFVVGAGSGFALFPLSILSSDSSRLTKQRKNFEQALDFMDNEVRRVYHKEDYQI